MSTATYLYAITRNDPSVDLSRLRGVDDEQLRLLADGELACVVGSVRLEDFGEAALARNLEDLGWLERVARRHDGVVRELAAQAATVPLRLAVLCHDDESARERTRAVGARAGEVLDRVEGCDEWGVKLFAPAPADEQAAAPAASGTAYLQMRRQALTERENLAVTAQRDAEAVYERLAERARAAVRHRPQDQRLTGVRAPMVLNAAFLVDRTGQSDFHAVASELAAQRSPDALVITGPWPPYSFTSLEDDE